MRFTRTASAPGNTKMGPANQYSKLITKLLKAKHLTTDQMANKQLWRTTLRGLYLRPDPMKARKEEVGEKSNGNDADVQ